MADEFRVLEDGLARFLVREPGGVVGVHVGEEDRVDVGGLDAGGGEVCELLASACLHEVAAARLHQHRLAAGVDEEGVDGRAPRGPEVRRQDVSGEAGVDVAKHLEVTVEEAVGDRGDDDVADLAPVDAGDLGIGDGRHRVGSFWGGMVGAAWRSGGPEGARRRAGIGASLGHCTGRGRSAME